MFDVGFGEVALVTVVALLVFGPEKLPTLARQVGKMVGGAKKVMADVKTELDKAVDVDADQSTDQNK